MDASIALRGHAKATKASGSVDRELSVLLVDDDPDSLVALEALLLDGPWNVERARSGEEALRLLCSIDCGLVVLDVRMPSMDGFEVARLMRRTRRTQQIPILFLTGLEPQPELQLEGLRLGGVDCVRKTTPAPVLRAKVERLMSLSQGKHELEHLSARLAQEKEVLERANRELEAFAYSAAHDLSAPLRQIEQYLQLVQRRSCSGIDEDSTRWLGRASESARRLTQTIHGLLDFARMDHASPMNHNISGNEVVNEAAANLSLVFDQLGGRLDVGTLPLLLGPRVQLVRLFQNLFENSLKFAGEAPPRIQLDARVQGARVYFTVSDNGRGIPEGVQATVFDLFSRGAEPDDGRGSGIGLASCKRIVERLGGQIRLDPTTRRGTTFCFDLPAAEGQTAAFKRLDSKVIEAEVGPSSEPHADLADPLWEHASGEEERAVPQTRVSPLPLRVLIIHDSPDERAGIRRELCRMSDPLDVSEAPDGHVGIELYEQCPFACVILSDSLPGIASTEVIRRLLRLDADVRILATSRRRDDQWRRELMHSGAVATFSPLELRELGRLQGLLRRATRGTAVADASPTSGPTSEGRC